MTSSASVPATLWATVVGPDEVGDGLVVLLDDGTRRQIPADLLAGLRPSSGQRLVLHLGDDAVTSATIGSVDAVVHH